jgi:hypothetical protein
MNIVADHLQSLLAILPINSTTCRPIPKSSLTEEETKLFWKYHGRFPNDFARAILNSLPDDLQFVSYDHLSNLITVKAYE